MTNSEFSDTFTTLLNSYNTQAQFGQQASQREIVLDEYEKSVLLTQAQDIIVKSYFDAATNSVGQGFDDSARRQVDFSSLIKVAQLSPTKVDEDSTVTPFDSRGILYDLPSKTNGEGTLSATVLFILNEKLIYTPKTTTSSSSTASESSDEEEPETTTSSMEFVIIPINYKEYDREMSKPYAQPLKKQAWRLFQNTSTGFDLQTELIPRWNYKSYYDEGEGTFTYKIRYVKRPQPIILEDLPDYLEIDGETEASECELNPILHMDILNKAVELAVSTRGGGTAQSSSSQNS